MAELVDALVSNTNGAIRAGSIPAPGTGRLHNHTIVKPFSFIGCGARLFGGYLISFPFSRRPVRGRPPAPGTFGKSILHLVCTIDPFVLDGASPNGGKGESRRLQRDDADNPTRGRSIQQPARRGVANRLHRIVHLQLFQDPLPVRVDRVDADEQLIGNLLREPASALTAVGGGSGGAYCILYWPGDMPVCCLKYFPKKDWVEKLSS